MYDNKAFTHYIVTSRQYTEYFRALSNNNVHKLLQDRTYKIMHQIYLQNIEIVDAKAFRRQYGKTNNRRKTLVELLKDQERKDDEVMVNLPTTGNYLIVEDTISKTETMMKVWTNISDIPCIDPDSEEFSCPFIKATKFDRRMSLRQTQSKSNFVVSGTCELCNVQYKDFDEV